MDPNRIPDGIEPLVGYRGWSAMLEHRHASLHSLSCSDEQPCPWDRPPFTWATASCSLRMGHKAPCEGCWCGIYALKDLSELTATAEAGWFGESVVLGRVELAGKIIEHDTGYRAERARIVELIPVEGQIREVMLVANRLGLPMSRAVPGPPPVSQEDLRILEMAAEDTDLQGIAATMNISCEEVVRRLNRTVGALSGGPPARAATPHPTDRRQSGRLRVQRRFWWLLPYLVHAFPNSSLN